MENTTENRGAQPEKSSRKGFASMSPEQRRAVASAGGTAAHKSGKAHKFDSESAREAGRKGGKSLSENRDYMSMIGQKGGETRSRNAALSKAKPEPAPTPGPKE